MPPLVRRELFEDIGWAEAQAGVEPIRVGDYLVPPAIHVTFPGAEGHPGLEMRLEVVEGVPQCRELRIASVDGGRGVEGRDLGVVRLGEWIDAIVGRFSDRIVEERDGQIVAVVRSGETLRAAAMVRRARQHRDLGEVASVYRSAKRAPTKAVAEHFGVAHRTAALWVKQARDAGLLPATTPGRAAR